MKEGVVPTLEESKFIGKYREDAKFVGSSKKGMDLESIMVVTILILLNCSTTSLILLDAFNLREMMGVARS